MLLIRALILNGAIHLAGGADERLRAKKRCGGALTVAWRGYYQAERPSFRWTPTR